MLYSHTVKCIFICLYRTQDGGRAHTFTHAECNAYTNTHFLLCGYVLFHIHVPNGFRRIDFVTFINLNYVLLEFYRRRNFYMLYG